MRNSFSQCEWEKYENKIDHLFQEVRDRLDPDETPEFKTKDVNTSPHSRKFPHSIIRQSNNRPTLVPKCEDGQSPSVKPISVRKTLIRAGASKLAMIANVAQNTAAYSRLHSSRMYNKKEIPAFPTKVWISIDDPTEEKSIPKEHSQPNKSHQRTEQEYSVSHPIQPIAKAQTASEIILTSLQGRPGSPDSKRKADALSILREHHQQLKRTHHSSQDSSVEPLHMALELSSEDTQRTYPRRPDPTRSWCPNYRVSDKEFYMLKYTNRSPSLLKEITLDNMSKKAVVSLNAGQSQTATGNSKNPDRSSIILRTCDSPTSESPRGKDNQILSPRQKIHPSLDRDLFRSSAVYTTFDGKKNKIILRASKSLKDDPDEMLLGYLGMKKNVRESRAKSAMRVQEARERKSVRNLFSQQQQHYIERPCQKTKEERGQGGREEGSGDPGEKVVELAKIDPVVIAQAMQTQRKKVSVLLPPRMSGSFVKFHLQAHSHGLAKPRGSSVDYSLGGAKHAVAASQLAQLPPQTGLSLLSEVLGHHKREREELVHTLKQATPGAKGSVFRLVHEFSSRADRYSPVEEYLERMAKMGKLHAST